MDTSKLACGMAALASWGQVGAHSLGARPCVPALARLPATALFTLQPYCIQTTCGSLIPSATVSDCHPTDTCGCYQPRPSPSRLRAVPASHLCGTCPPDKAAAQPLVVADDCGSCAADQILVAPTAFK